jgi:hypothetical protein
MVRFIYNAPNTRSTSAEPTSGLGNYLYELDRSKRWYQHLCHTLVLCQVHIIRNFRKRYNENHPAVHQLPAL